RHDVVPRRGGALRPRRAAGPWPRDRAGLARTAASVAARAAVRRARRRAAPRARRARRAARRSHRRAFRPERAHAGRGGCGARCGRAARRAGGGGRERGLGRGGEGDARGRLHRPRCISLALAREPGEGRGGALALARRSAMNEPAVLARDLTRTFGRFVAVDRVTFSVAAGEVYGFLGPNGAGKTTTLRMLTGLLRPSAGEGR